MIRFQGNGSWSSRRAYDLSLYAALAISVLLFLVPQFFFIRQSFYEGMGMGLTGDQPTLVNYTRLLTDSFYLDAFVRTLTLSALATLGIGPLEPSSSVRPRTFTTMLTKDEISSRTMSHRTRPELSRAR